MFRSVRSWALALSALAFVPSTALAWTDATVRTAHARVALSEDASTLHVVITAELRVDRGWLKGFELDGLDEGLVLDESHPVRFERWAVPEVPAPAPVRGPGGELVEVEAPRPPPIFVDLLEPRVAVHDARVALSFTRRHAPRSGIYRVIVTYDAPAEGHVVRAPDHAELVWTLPAWRFGLDNVEVIVVAPEGSAPSPLAEEDEVAIGFEPTELEEGETGVAYRFTRVHLPRTQSWTVHTQLPEAFWAPEVESAVPVPVAFDDAPASHPAALLFAALVLAALVIAKARSREQEAEAAGATTGALLPLRARAVVVLAVAGLWIAAALIFVHPDRVPLAALGLALLGAHRPSRAGSLRLGSFRSAWGGHVRAARVALSARRGADLLDASTLPGAAVLLGVLATLGLATLGGWLVATDAVALFASALLVLASGGGTGRARPARVVLAELLRWSEARRSWPEGVALAPLVHVDIQGRVQAARLRLVLDGAPEGLVRSDVVLDERTPRLVFVARDQTPAQRALLDLATAQGWPLAEASEGRLALVLDLARLPALVGGLRPSAERAQLAA